MIAYDHAGMYCGCMYTEYNTLILSLGQSLPAQAVIGSGLSYLTGRMSYIFGCTGGKR
jgi:acyl transferase domain-containing protein